MLENIKFNSACKGVIKPLIAVSGGVDSMVLLELVLQYAEFETFEVVYCDHGVRSRDEISYDVTVIKERLSEHNIKFHVCKVPVHSKHLGMSIEAFLRQERLKIYQKLCHEFDLDAVLLGHHLDDHCETIMMQLCTGSGSRLRGILPRQRLAGLLVCRPLLNVSKLAIRQFAESINLNYSEDSTNQSTDYLRNRFRHQLMPVLSELSPQFKESFLRFSDYMSLRAENDQERLASVFSRVTYGNDYLSIPTDQLRQLPTYDQSNLLLVLLDKLSSNYRIKKVHIQLIIDELTRCSGKFSMNLSKDLCIDISSKSVVLYLKAICSNSYVLGSINIGQTYFSKNGAFSFSTSYVNTYQSSSGMDSEYLDLALVDSNSLLLRFVESSDQFIPFGQEQSINVMAFLKQQGVLLPLRSRTLVLLDKDRIVWVLGYRLSNHVKVSNSTQQILKLEYVLD